MLQSMGFQKLRHDLATELKVLQTPASTGDTTKLPLWSFFRDRPVSGKAECQHKAKWRLHGLNGHWCLQQDMFGWSSGCWKKAEKNQRHYFADKGPSSQSYGFSSNHVWIWELDHKESWVPKNWCFWAVVLEKTLESPLDIKEIKPVHPKGNQPWIFIGRTDAEAEGPILWPSNEKSQLLGKDPDAGKDWRQEEKRMIEDEMVVWHHWLNGNEFKQALGDGNGQGSLACCCPWGCKELDRTKWLNNKWVQKLVSVVWKQMIGLQTHLCHLGSGSGAKL